MKILVFAPHSAIWVHAFPEALVAETLRQAGHQVTYVSCGGTLRRYCVPMSAHQLTPEAAASRRYEICAKCTRYDGILRTEFGFDGPRLTELTTEEHAINEILTGVTRGNLLTLERDGVALGRIALYQLILQRKRFDIDLTEAEWQEYLVELRNTLYAWQAGRKLLDTVRPDRVIVYNGLYSVNRAVCKLAEQRGILHYFMHAGGNLSNRLQTMLIGRGDTFSFMPHIVSEWPRFSSVPCNARLLSLVTDHYEELIRGRSVFVYSSKKSQGKFDVRARFSVGKEQKLLVATLGSYDEEVAAEMVGARKHRTTPLFPTQIEWVQSLLEFVARRPDLFLIVRVHPREFPNRRDAVLSQHARHLQSMLAHLPVNAAVNWPGDGISLYDLADRTDVFLNSWSSVGKEMSLLGIPVVIYSRELPFYPPDLNYVGTTREEYFQAIDQALSEGWSLERARAAYRWGAFEFVRATIFLGDSYPEKEQSERALPRRMLERVRRSIDPDFKQRADCKHRQLRLSAASQVVSLIESGKASVPELLDPASVERADETEETLALIVELNRLASALFATTEARAHSRLYARLTPYFRS